MSIHIRLGDLKTAASIFHFCSWIADPSCFYSNKIRYIYLCGGTPFLTPKALSLFLHGVDRLDKGSNLEYRTVVVDLDVFLKIELHLYVGLVVVNSARGFASKFLPH